jgi:Reverse transcriptase (RNA-dependent DNA polymerase)
VHSRALRASGVVASALGGHLGGGCSIDASRKRMGTCPDCFATYKLIGSRGTICSHGHRGRNCAGSHKLPVEASAPSLGRLQGPQAGGSGVQSQNAPGVAEPAAEEVREGPQGNPLRGGTPQGQGNGPTSQQPTRTSAFVHQSDLSHPTTYGPPIKWIPRAARARCATALDKTLRDVIKDPANRAKWSRLLSFTGAILAKPRRGGTKRNLSNVILKRICEFESGAVSSAGLPSECKAVKTRKVKTDNAILASLVQAKIEEGNFKAAIRIVCSDDKPAPVSTSTRDALQQKHPPRASDRLQLGTSSSHDRFKPLEVTEADVRATVISFPPGSSGGPDGLLPQHLKDLTADRSGEGSLLATLTDMVNLLLSGELPSSINRIIFGGRLIALEKKDGGIRPICVGYTLRRLAAKVANSHVSDRAAALLAPRQLGVGTPRGAEGAVHATRRYLQTLPSGYVLVKLDFRNAFNSLCRDRLLQCVAQSFPEIYRFVFASYSESTELRVRGLHGAVGGGYAAG